MYFSSAPDCVRGRRDVRAQRLPVGSAVRDRRDGRANGVALEDELEEHYGDEINHGRSYPDLNALAEKGTIDDRTNAYVLTDAGRQELRDRRRWEDDYLEAAEVGS